MSMQALQLGIMATNRRPSEISYITNATDSVDRTTYTFAGQSIGTASNDRVVIVTVGSRANDSKDITGVTIGGVTATQVVRALYVGAGVECAAIYAATVPAGTTADIVVTFSGPMIRCAIGIFVKTGSTGVSASDTDVSVTNTAGAFNASVDVPDKGTVLCMCASSTSGVTTWTLSGVTEDFDVPLESTSTAYAAGHDNYASGQTVNLTATATATPLNGAVAIASWG